MTTVGYSYTSDIL